jgi:outer membrane murein-binding lipoprotein Lpp
MTFDKLSKEIQTLNAEVKTLTEKQLQLVIQFAEVKRTHNNNKDNVVGLNEYQQRINKNPVGGGWYHFYGVSKII